LKIVAANILRVEQERIAAEPVHLKALLRFAERATAGRFERRTKRPVSLFTASLAMRIVWNTKEALRDSIVRVLECHPISAIASI